LVKLLVDIKNVRTKVDQGKYLSLKEKREYLRWCINQEVDNKQIIDQFSKYDLNISQFVFMLNDLRASLRAN
jgi:hypothetical protein